MTREQTAMYLMIMAWMESEPVTMFEFEVKINTERRRNYADILMDGIKNRLGENSCRGYCYYSKNREIDWITRRSWDPELDTKKFTVYAGSWSDKEHIEWLTKELN